ncbi:MAG: DUF2934 domain-containing protein [Nitrospirae bacterium]|nr:DUF2934 domain-containing protein [Nitrospirota bacterium]
MARTIVKKLTPAETSSSKTGIDLHNLDLQKNDAQSLNSLISETAYQLYLKRGGEHGHDLGDWLEAELIVQAQMKSGIRT